MTTVAKIRNNKLYVYSTGEGSDFTPTFFSKIALQGDFDVQIDYETLTHVNDASNGNFVGLKVRNIDDDLEYVLVDKMYIGGGLYYRVYSYYGAQEAAYASADAEGKFRITRSGSTFVLYIWNSQWEWQGNTAGKTSITTFSDDVVIELIFAGRASQTNEYTLSNLKVIDSNSVDFWEILVVHSDTWSTSASPSANQNFVDSSPREHTILVNGSTDFLGHTYDQFPSRVIGATSIRIEDGSTTFPYIDYHTNFILSDYNWEIECLVRVDDIASTNTFLSRWDEETATRKGFKLGMDTSGHFIFNFSINGSTTLTVTSTSTFSADTWYHFKVSRQGADILCFVNGTQMAAVYNIATNSIYNDGVTDFIIGAFKNSGGTYDGMRGYISEIVVRKRMRAVDNNPTNVQYSRLSYDKPWHLDWLDSFDTIQTSGGIITLSNGNKTVTKDSGSNWTSAINVNPLDEARGFYWEVSFINETDIMVGVVDRNKNLETLQLGENAKSYGYRSSDGNKINDGSSVSYGDSFGGSDIVGVLYDANNEYLYFSKNGIWQNSGNPLSPSGYAFSSVVPPMVPGFSLKNTDEGINFVAHPDDLTYKMPLFTEPICGKDSMYTIGKYAHHEILFDKFHTLTTGVGFKWTDDDAGAGATTQEFFTSVETLKLYGGTGGGTDVAMITKSFGSWSWNRFIVSFKVYHDDIGATQLTDAFSWNCRVSSTESCQFSFGNDGLSVYLDAGWTLILPGYVEETTWTEWSFDITLSLGSSAATADIYKNGQLVLSNQDVYRGGGSYTDGDISFYQESKLTSGKTSHLQWVKVSEYWNSQAYPTTYGKNEIYSNDCTSLVGWSDQSSNGSVTATTSAGESIWKFEVPTGGAGNKAGIRRDIGTLAGYDRLITTLSLYHDYFGSWGNDDYFEMLWRYSTSRTVIISIASDGVRVYDASLGWQYIYLQGSATSLDVWTTWTFDLDTVNEVMDIYINGILVVSEANANVAGSLIDGEIYFYQYGDTTSGMITYMNYFTMSAYQSRVEPL